MRSVASEPCSPHRSGRLHRSRSQDRDRAMVRSRWLIFVLHSSDTRSYSGGPKVPFRGGRVDAKVPNSPGVPEPQQDLESHIAAFARQGFTQTEMISLIACGHSFGGVQHSAFPDTVPLPDGVDDVSQTFDSTPFNFDNAM